LEEHYETKAKDVLDYEIGGKRGFRADCFISSEPLNSTVDYVYVDDYKNGKRYFEGPQKRRYFRQKPDGQYEQVDEPLVEEKKEAKPKPKPKTSKSTGGKLSYTKVYGSRLKKMRDKLGFELLGVCLCLTEFIEWETGFLIVGRGKRRRPITKEDLVIEWKVSLSTVKRHIKRLAELEVLKIDEGKFRLNARFLAKGRTFDAD